MTIYAGESLDRYGDSNEENLSRNAERIDWRRVPVRDLHVRSSAIGYLDAAGIRFYTPAIMSTILREEDDLGNMTDSWFWALNDFRKNCNIRGIPYKYIYNRSQRAAIIRFLKYHIHNTRYGRSDIELRKTLAGLQRCGFSNASG